MAPQQNQRSFWLILLVSVVLRLPTFCYDYVNIDETDLTLAGQVILNGGLPYRDFMVYQPPVIYYLYAFGFWLSGGIHLWAVHWIAILFAAFTGMTLCALIRRMTDSVPAGLVAGLAYAIYSTIFIPQDMLAANCEILMMLPMSLGAYFFWRADQEGRKRFYFAAGLFFGLGVLTKYQGGVLLIAALIYVCIGSPWIRKQFPLRKMGNAILFLMGGSGLPFILFLTYFYWKGSLSHTLELFNYIMLYSKDPPQTDALYVLLKFIVRSFLFCLTSLPIWKLFPPSPAHPTAVNIKRNDTKPPNR